MPDDDDDAHLDHETQSVRVAHRLAKVTAARDQYRRELETLQAKHAADQAAWTAERATLTAADPTIEADRAELAQLRESSSAWQVERDLMAAGLTDPEGMEYARHAYSRIAEADRPKGGIGEWLKGDKLPKAVSAYLPTADAGTAAPAGGRAVDPNKGVAPPRGVAPGAKTPEQSLRDGTWKQDKEALAAEMGIKLHDLKTAFHRPA